MNIVPSPFGHFGLDNLISEKIFSYLDGQDYLSASCVSLNWRSFILMLLRSRRMGRLIETKIDKHYHLKWFQESYAVEEIGRETKHYAHRRYLTFEDQDAVVTIKKKVLQSGKIGHIVEMAPKRTYNNRSPRTVSLPLTQGIKRNSVRMITLVGDNLEFYFDHAFMLCYERGAYDNSKWKLLIQSRHKLRGYLSSYRVLRVRNDADDPSFSRQMTQGHLLAILPGSNKLAVAKEPFAVSVFTINEDLTLIELYKIRVPQPSMEPHIMICAQNTLLSVSNYTAAYIYETSGYEIDMYSTLTLPLIRWEGGLEKITKLKMSQKFLAYQVLDLTTKMSKLGVLQFGESSKLSNSSSGSAPSYTQLVSWLALKKFNKYDNVFDLCGSRLVVVQPYQSNRDAIWLSDLAGLTDAISGKDTESIQIVVPSTRLTVLEPNVSVTSVSISKSYMEYAALVTGGAFPNVHQTYRVVIEPASVSTDDQSPKRSMSSKGIIRRQSSCEFCQSLQNMNCYFQ